MPKKNINQSAVSGDETPLFWPAKMKGGVLFVLDETLIPDKVSYIKVTTVDEAVKVIQNMKTRAFGQLLVVLNAFFLGMDRFNKVSDKQPLAELVKIANALNGSRPTFPFAEVTGMVLHWAQKAAAQDQDIKQTVTRNINGYLQGIRTRRMDRVNCIAKFVKKGDCVLTHCNVSGELALAALICKKEKKPVRFFATETRPYLQGAKLTCWELQRVGSDVTLVADNAIGSLMADQIVNKVIVGSDRSCANGDFANKIGTYQIAVLAKEFKIPFYVLTQPSNRIKKGVDIPVEIREEGELLRFNGKKILPGKVRGFYPGFDIVPHKFVTKDIPINVN